MTVPAIAVLDADVLFPMILRDTLLRVAAAGGYRAHWSAKILDEVTRNLIDKHKMDAAKATSLTRAMANAFPDAMVEGWEPLEAAMPNHPKDRHVAATAKKVGAGIVVTSNLKDFSVMPGGITAMSPDTFLTQSLGAKPEKIMAALRKQAAGYRNPAMTTSDLIETLARVVPDYSRAAKALLPAM